MSQVLHIDFVALDSKVADETKRGLIREAEALLELEQVLRVGVIEPKAGADFDLAFFFVLPDFTALEPFGTQPRYTRFLQGYVAPVLRAFAGADVTLQDEVPAAADYAACLALAADDETYDWEVRATLNDWSRSLQMASCVTGLAVGERQRYRGLALAIRDFPVNSEFAPPDERFTATLISGTLRSFP